jgi:hypothetical protein
MPFIPVSPPPVYFAARHAHNHHGEKHTPLLRFSSHIVMIDYHGQPVTTFPSVNSAPLAQFWLKFFLSSCDD